METFEYLSEKQIFKHDYKEIEYLNHMGSKGYELCAIRHWNNEITVYIWKIKKIN
jgi:hypothetical protein